MIHRGNGKRYRREAAVPGCLSPHQSPTGIFQHRGEPPSDDQLWSTLDLSAGLWEMLVKDVRNRFPRCLVIWRYGEAGEGWRLAVIRHGRLVLQMTPLVRAFVVSVSLGDRPFPRPQTDDLPWRPHSVSEPVLPTSAVVNLLHLPVNSTPDLQAVRTVVESKVSAVKGT